jgi:hypothetical protein
MKINFVETRGKPSESLMNVFEEFSSPTKKTSDADIRTLESFNSSNPTENASCDQQQDQIDPMLQMSKQEYLESVFGPSLNISNVKMRDKISKLLLSNYIHFIVFILIIINNLCIIMELAIDLEIKQQNAEELHVADNFFKYLGFSVVCLFVLEISLKLIFTFKNFLKSKLQIIDSLVVALIFTLNIIFLINHQATLLAISKLLVFLNLKYLIFFKLDHSSIIYQMVLSSKLYETMEKIVQIDQNNHINGHEKSQSLLI